ncbi:MAG: hypothetical protein KDH09_12970, partial [Chrysiogenetes bacterium]|nr:hypothetical protein [Chrysiogenetes bacterium]
MLKLGLLNADLDVGGVGVVEEAQLFRLTDSEKKDFEKKLPDLNALVADLNLINIDSFRFLKGFSDQLTERVRDGGLLLCFTSRPNLHSPDGIQNKYSWLPLFDDSKEVREDLVDKIQPGEGANGVSSALGNLIDSFYATCSFPEGFGTEPYNTLLQGEDGLAVGLAKPLGKGWVLLIPQAEEKGKVLESALQWWDETLKGGGAPAGDENEPLAASDEVDASVDAPDDGGDEFEHLDSEPVDLDDLSAAPAGDEEPPADLGELELDAGAAPEENEEVALAVDDAAPSDESAEGDEVADMGDLEAGSDLELDLPPETDETPEEESAADEEDDSAPDEENEDLESVLAAPSGEEDEFAASSDGTEADSSESEEFSAEDREMISALKVLLGKDFEEVSALPTEKLREIYESHVEEARRKVFEGAQNELTELLEASGNQEEESASGDSGDEEEEESEMGSSVDDIGLEVPSAPSWMDEFKAKVPGISDIVEEAEKLETEARRLLDQAGELRGRVDALSRWDPLLYLGDEAMAEELGEFFHVVLGADASIEDDLDDGRPALKLLSAEGDFLVHVATDNDPVSEDVGRALMRHLADVDVDTKGMLVLNGSLGRTPPRNPEEHAQKKLIKLAAKRGLVVVSVNQLYRLGLKAQQDEEWDPEPIL